MKILINVIFILIIPFSLLQSQSYFRVKVIDSITKVSVEGATVFIEEIPIGDKITDNNGFVSYQNIPSDRKVRIHVHKDGFIPQLKEIVAHKDIGPDNNILIELVKIESENSKIIWGEITDQHGRELVSTTIELIIAGEPYFTRSDESGNYRFQLKEFNSNWINSIRIEAKKEGCRKYVKDYTLPKSSVANYDIRLNCNKSVESSETLNNHLDNNLNGGGVINLGVWIFTDHFRSILKSNGIRTPGDERFKYALELMSDQGNLTGRMLWVEGAKACGLNNLIKGTYSNGEFDFSITYLGECCPGTAYHYKGKIVGDNMIGEISPHGLPTGACFNGWCNLVATKQR